MKRRNFLKTMGVGAISMAVFNEYACSGNVGEQLPSIGLITGLGGRWLRDNPREALTKIAEWGYTDLEFGGTLGGMQNDELLPFLQSLGLKPLIGSAGMASIIDEDLLKADIKRSLDQGKQFVACYWPWISDGQGQKIDDWKEVADNLNKGAAVCQREGITLIYHNHDLEFYPVEGQMPFDVLMSRLDPAVGIELDLYWITKGGQSAVEYIQKYPGRFPVFHVKDMPDTVKCGQGQTDFSTLTERDFACVGSGCIDFAEIFKLNKVSGAKHFVVENDKPDDPATCIESSAKNLLALRF